MKNHAAISALLLLTASTPRALAQDPGATSTKPTTSVPSGGSFLGSIPAIDFTAGTGGCGGNNSQSVGWSFDVVNTVSVDHMAWFDDGLDGLEIEHEVAIWAPGGSMVAGTNVTIPAGVAAALDGHWRVVPISPVTLPPGAGYIVGGYNGFHAECLTMNIAQTVHPDLNYIDATFSPLGAGLAAPTNFSIASSGFYGPGFMIGDGLGTNYCTSLANSTGAPAVISVVGSASVAANNLVLSAQPVPNQPGIFYYGPQQVMIPFGNGFRCVGGTVGRLSVEVGAGNIIDHALDNTMAPNASTVITAGSTWNFQCWYRDPVAGGPGFNLSDGVEAQFVP